MTNMSKWLAEEIEMRGEAMLDAGELPDTKEILRDVADWLDNAIPDAPRAERAALRKHRDEVMRLEVAAGLWRAINDDAARERVRNGLGVRMAHFPVLDGQRYEWVGARGES